MNTAIVTLKIYLKNNTKLEDVIEDWNLRLEHEDIEHAEIISCGNEKKAKGFEDSADIDLDGFDESLLVG